MRIFSIDPGTSESAYVIYTGDRVDEHAILPNHQLLEVLKTFPTDSFYSLAIEGIACMGMSVGKEVFETCIWVGRFIEGWGGDNWSLVYRNQVKLHLCGSARAKDTNIRQSLLDKFGPGKDRAVGVKKKPGPLYGIRSHEWSALAVAVTYWETQRVSVLA